ncbi:hypothetical protein ABIB25_004340 [Nakamurella sp. UYEF19]|uniref:hypothetical protein n=1 Tax=Nakamurella sp. UYEF19 TaxID=1756392 RepID=UPI003397781B
MLERTDRLGQLLGLTRDQATEAQRLVTCRELASGLTRMPDLTAGGRLTLPIVD